MKGSFGRIRTHKAASTIRNFVPLVALFVVTFAPPAFAVTFSNPAPQPGLILKYSGNRTVTLDAVASSGQTLNPIGQLVLDGAPPTNASASYAIDHWEPYYDGEYGEWYDIPIYDTTRATFNAGSKFLSQGAHTMTLTVTEAPSGQTFTYTWEIPAEGCKNCHDDMPAAHATATTACATCHASSGPVQVHNTGFGGCDNCHGTSSHGADRLSPHTYYDLDGNPYEREERACTSCHSPSYPAIPQIGVNHGDPTAAHAPVIDPACTECHESDLTALHPDCNTCHDPDVPAGATCVTCHPEKADPHGKYAGFSATTQYVSWAQARSLASANADAALMAQGSHKGYATTTIKCAVCHSVHRGGSKLLNEGTSCAFCHTPAYYGGGAVASNLISWTTATNQGPHASRCANDDCHGGPHGVGASVYDGPASRLLTARADAKMAADATANGVDVATLSTYSPSTRVLATGAVCSRAGCHVDSAFGIIASGSDLAVEPMPGTPSGADGMVTGHRVIASATSNWNANGTDFPTAKTNLTVAFAPVDYCSDCHDLADDNNGGKAAFPHAINGVVDAEAGADGTTRPAVWLTASARAGAPRTAVGPYNRYTGGAGVAGAAGSSVIDGVCLKCHRSSVGTQGVGFTY